MLAVSWDTVRLFLHVLAATIWVGGQLTLAALVPVLRRLGAEIPRAAARRFNQVAWPAFAVLIITGAWNIAAVRSQVTGSYEATLVAKLIVVAISGVTAALHARARSTAGLAVFGALTGVSALAALFLGVLLAGLGHRPSTSPGPRPNDQLAARPRRRSPGPQSLVRVPETGLASALGGRNVRTLARVKSSSAGMN
jgi:putative copper export protein